MLLCFREHQFMEVGEPKSGPQELKGPLYIIDNKHNYNIVQPKPPGLSNLEGPVYNIEETRHHFNELKKTVDSVKSLTGPVYDCGHANQFQVGNAFVDMKALVHNYFYPQDIIKHAEKLQNLVGPVYGHGVEHTNHFNEIISNAQSIKELKGPVYDVGHQSKFNEIVKGVERIEKLIGPVYIDEKHGYSESARPVDQAKKLTGPVYVIDRQEAI